MRKIFVPVELTVTVTVLAVGALMAVPAVAGKMRAFAAREMCADNLKGFHQAIQCYADENEGFTPEARPGNTSPRNWWKLLAPNLDPLPGMRDWNNPGLVKGEFGFFKCPENTRQIYLANYFGPQDPRTQSYTANTYHGFSENRFMGEKISGMTAPAQLIALFEGNYPRAAVWNENASDSATKVSEPRHGGSMNILYADGHIALRQGVLPGQGKHLGGPGRGAPDWENGSMWYAK